MASHPREGVEGLRTSGSVALAPTQSNEAEEQPQQQQPGEQQAQQPLPPAAARATGAPGRCSPPRSPAGGTATSAAAAMASFASATTSTSVIVVVFCGRNREGELNSGGSCQPPFKIGGIVWDGARRLSLCAAFPERRLESKSENPGLWLCGSDETVLYKMTCFVKQLWDETKQDP